MQLENQAQLIDAPLGNLMARAGALRDEGFGQIVTYSRNCSYG